ELRVDSESPFKYRHSPGFAVTEGAALAAWLRAGSVHARSANAVDRRKTTTQTTFFSESFPAVLAIGLTIITLRPLWGDFWETIYQTLQSHRDSWFGRSAFLLSRDDLYP